MSEQSPDRPARTPKQARAPRRAPDPAPPTPHTTTPPTGGAEQPRTSGRTPRNATPRPVRGPRAGVEEYQPATRVPRRRTARPTGPPAPLRVARAGRPPTTTTPPADATPAAATGPTPTATAPARATPMPPPRAVQVFEDHDVPDSARQKVWQDLVDWVIWLHDAYELSLEEALPECWVHHPGLVRELAALRAWRAEIYLPYPKPPTGPGTPAPVPVPNGGVARAWHTEMRNVLGAAKKMYAPRCRAGHHDATTTWLTDTTQRDTWIAARPQVLHPHRNHLPWPTAATAPTAPPGPPGPAGTPGQPGVMSDEQMRQALDTGQATGAGAHTHGYLRHQDTWWIRRPEGDWLTITDPALTGRLDRYAAATALARDAVADTHRPGPC